MSQTHSLMGGGPSRGRTRLLVLLAGLTGSACAGDPASLWRSAREHRNLDCARVPLERAHELHPGLVPAPSARARTFELTDALLCSWRFLGPDERPARDEAILSTLRSSVQELAQAAAALSPADATWHVDAFYPEPAVAAKIAVAARTELAERRRRVSDRVPVLAAGDLAVLRGLHPRQAYALACARYFAERSLGDGDVFLGLMVLDAREAQLHAGLCTHDGWRWLR